MTSKEEVSNIIFKGIGYFLLGAAIFFIFVVILAKVYFYYTALPKITSDTMLDDSDISTRSMLLSDIQREIRRVLGGDKMPLKNAKSLYFASEGPLFPSYYIAFQMNSKNECENLFRDEGYFAFKNFQKGNFSIEGPWQYHHLPHEWAERYQDRNWPLKEGDEFLYRGDYQKLILYTPEDNRIYICIDNGP